MKFEKCLGSSEVKKNCILKKLIAQINSKLSPKLKYMNKNYLIKSYTHYNNKNCKCVLYYI